MNEGLIFKGEIAFAKFLDEVYPQWRQNSGMKETPHRVAKMYVNELLAGIWGEEPKMTTFENDTMYSGMVFQGNIKVHSICEHHFMPFFGVANVSYIPADGKIIGLSKLNRLVSKISHKPQVQERLTQEIHDELNQLLPGNKGIAVNLECSHSCVFMRGVKEDSVMKTAVMSGMYFSNEIGTRDEYLRYVADLKR